jgi:hypothetical protein
MTETTNLLAAGQTLLKDVALFYATQHGMRPDTIEWTEQYDQWWLKVTTADHSVKVVFSRDEIEDFAADGDGSKSSKVKIRNAFAGLAM